LTFYASQKEKEKEKREKRKEKEKERKYIYIYIYGNFFWSIEILAISGSRIWKFHLGFRLVFQRGFI
jgi:hypothetical protein